jgi:hypothetical protein
MGLYIFVIHSKGVGMVIFLINNILNVRPAEIIRKKTIISLHHFFFTRGGISYNEIMTPVNKIPMIAHIDHYSPISF